MKLILLHLLSNILFYVKHVHHMSSVLKKFEKLSPTRPLFVLCAVNKIIRVTFLKIPMKFYKTCLI